MCHDFSGTDSIVRAEERWECEGRRVMLRQTHLGQLGHLLLQTQPSGSLSKLNWNWKIKTGSPNFQLFGELNVF